MAENPEKKKGAKKSSTTEIIDTNADKVVVEVEPGANVEIVTKTEPEQTPTPSPEVTPEVTPAPKSEPTPVPTPVAAPKVFDKVGFDNWVNNHGRFASPSELAEAVEQFTR